MEVDGIFSSHKDSIKLVSAIFKSANKGWFLIVKLVKVPGRYNFLILPPSGRMIPLILVPVK